MATFFRRFAIERIVIGKTCDNFVCGCFAAQRLFPGPSESVDDLFEPVRRIGGQSEGNGLNSGKSFFGELSILTP